MRLIDADALLEDMRKHSESYFADDFAEYWVDRQPTVAPAAQPKDVVDKNKLVETKSADRRRYLTWTMCHTSRITRP